MRKCTYCENGHFYTILVTRCKALAYVYLSSLSLDLRIIITLWSKHVTKVVTPLSLDVSKLIVLYLPKYEPCQIPHLHANYYQCQEKTESCSDFFLRFLRFFVGITILTFLSQILFSEWFFSTSHGFQIFKFYYIVFMYRKP